MKKRAVEAVLILAALIGVFVLVNLFQSGISGAVRQIDGQYYSISERELSLTLMTTDGTDSLSDFTRLKKLKVTPYKAQVKDAIRTDIDADVSDALKQEAENVYSDCTDLEDISFVSLAPALQKLDVSLCAVSDISCLENMSLTELNISHTKVSDLTPLTDMDSIQVLYIEDIPAEDFSPLLEMKGLKKVTGDKKLETVADALRDKGVEVIITE